MTLREEIEKFIKENDMLRFGDRLLVGVSGGADSVCLLTLLGELRDKLGIELLAVHIHHGIRGEEADGDELFVEELCHRMAVPFKSFRVSVPEEMKKLGLSEEETGRCLRYRIFEKLMKEGNFDKTALAHNRNDVAETLIYNEVRGSGLAGLSSLRPVRGKFIRPLLNTGRREIEKALEERGLSWREDRTNHEDEHIRNRLRHHVLPYLEEAVNGAALRHLYELSRSAAEASDFIRCEARKRSRQYLENKNGGLLIRQELLITEKKALRDEVLFLALEGLSGGRRDLGRIHLKLLYDLMQGKNGRRGDLPYSLTAEKQQDGVFIKKKKEEKNPSETPEIPLRIPGITLAGKWQLTAQLEEQVPRYIPEKRYTKWFDYDKIMKFSCLRHRLRGDRLVISTSGARKSLSDYCTDEKLPREERENLWLLAQGSEILWIIGRRTGESARVTEETKRVLRIEAREIRQETDLPAREEASGREREAAYEREYTDVDQQG